MSFPIGEGRGGGPQLQRQSKHTQVEARRDPELGGGMEKDSGEQRPGPRRSDSGKAAF